MSDINTPEGEFLEGIRLAVHRRTGQWPWMDQVEEDFLPLLARYKKAVQSPEGERERIALAIESERDEALHLGYLECDEESYAAGMTTSADIARRDPSVRVA